MKCCCEFYKVLFTVFLLLGGGLLFAQNSFVDDTYENEVNIIPKAALKSTEDHHGPGMYFEIEKPETPEPEFIRWTLSDKKGLYPPSYRESPSAVFYFPDLGVYTIQLDVYFSPLSHLSKRAEIHVTEHQILFLPLPLATEPSTVFDAAEYNTSLDLWKMLELTGRRAKPFSIAGVPWYVPAGALVAGTGVWLLSEDDDPVVPDTVLPELSVNDLSVQLQCPDGLTIDPLSNDMGEGLEILQVEGLSSENGQLLNSGLVEIFPRVSQTFSFNYTVSDTYDQMASAVVTVNVTLPDFQLNDLELEVVAGESVTGDVFQNDICTSCEIRSHSQAVEGTVTFSNGEFTYVANENSSGWIEFEYEAEDACGQNGSALVKIWVEPLCESEITLDAEASDCGLENGMRRVEVSPEGNYEFAWSDGKSSAEVDNSPPGNFAITVTDLDNGCVYEDEVVVDELKVHIIENYQVVAGNCVTTPDASFSLVQFDEGQFLVVLEGPDGILESTQSASQNSLDLTEIWPETFFPAGNYILVIYHLDAGEDCADEVEFVLEEEEFSLIANDDSYSVRQGLFIEGNVLENDEGTSVKVSNFEVPSLGSLQLEENGDFRYEAPENVTEVLELWYEISDTCGTTRRGMLIIQILPCVIDINFTADLADCGANNGSINVETLSEGDWSYEWSTPGDSGRLENIAAGTYQLTLTDAKTDCFEEFEFEVKTRGPMAQKDSLTIRAREKAEGNILANDEGEELQLYAYDQNVEGNLEIDNEGNLSFDPPDDFTGLIEFFYTVQDSCGGKDSALVTILVEPLSCEIEHEFEADTADCGIANGSIILHLDTDCDYELIWHSGSGGDTLNSQFAGEYEVTVILGGDVYEPDTLNLNYRIPEIPPSYILGQEVESATCLEEGEILLLLSSLGSGNYEVRVETESDQETFYHHTDSLFLSEYMDVFSAEYFIQLRDTSISCPIFDSLNVEVEEDFIEFELQDDNYEMLSGDSLIFNVLDNDLGTGLNVVDMTDPPFGILTIDSSGAGTFLTVLPDHGIVEVVYTVVDSCDNQSTATLTILVELPPCDFEVDFEKELPACGFSDGSLTSVVSPEGDYSFEWSNGQTSATATELEQGTYTLTVTDQLLQCDLVFSTSLDEEEADWILDAEAFPQGCQGGPDILLELQSPSGGNIVVNISGPGLPNLNITVPPGLTYLSDFINLQSGTYSIGVLPQGSKAACTQNTSIEVFSVNDPPEFSVINVVPPTGSGQSNGLINISISGGTTPYSVYLNGELYATTSQSPFSITGLSSGSHEIEVRDAQNCSAGSQFVSFAGGGGNSSYSLTFSNPVMNRNWAPSGWEEERNEYLQEWVGISPHLTEGSQYQWITFSLQNYRLVLTKSLNHGFNFRFNYQGTEWERVLFSPSKKLGGEVYKVQNFGVGPGLSKSLGPFNLQFQFSANLSFQHLDFTIYDSTSSPFNANESLWFGRISAALDYRPLDQIIIGLKAETKNEFRSNWIPDVSLVFDYEF